MPAKRRYRASVASRISRQTWRQSVHTLPAGAVASDRLSAARLPQNEHLAATLLVFTWSNGPPALLPAAVRTADSTQASQMNTFGPAISFATSLGGRPHQVQVASGPIRRVRQARRHHVPPAPLTIC